MTGAVPAMAEEVLHGPPPPAGDAPSQRLASLEMFQQHLGYQFANLDILCQALTHRSYLQNGPHAAEPAPFAYSDGPPPSPDAADGEARASSLPCERAGHNERLEFLGDAVLGLAISDLLFRQYPEQMEGSLSHRRSSLVNIHALARIAHTHHLGEVLHMGRGELLSGGRSKNSLLGNALEAIIGAIYLDGGYQAAYEVVKRLFADALTDCQPGQWEKDYKSLLQERLQGAGLALPDYPVVAMEGAPHERLFQIACVVTDGGVGDAPLSRVGFGRSKRSAEQSAAKAVYMALYAQETEGQESSWNGQGPEHASPLPSPTKKEADDACANAP
ncbi:MAG: ribonuclease III [Magnetococcus sp. YQC-3]